MSGLTHKAWERMARTMGRKQAEEVAQAVYHDERKRIHRLVAEYEAAQDDIDQDLNERANEHAPRGD